ncbi:MAG: asparaginase [Alphaproteobacteria bacterium]
MVNPVLVEITRAGCVESRHRASVAVCLASGEAVLSLGDTGATVFPRSAIKAFQALPLVSAGGVDKFKFDDAEIAVMCASHNAQPEHVKTVRAILAKIGLDETALECGAHRPKRGLDSLTLAKAGKDFGAVHNNCSGKHAGMLALAVLLGVEPRGYIALDHRVQKTIGATIEKIFGVALDQAPCGTDGCSVPTWGLPLENIARGFARLGTGEGLSENEAGAARAIRAAVAAHPFMVAGSKRFCTTAMGITGASAFVKTGAEGVMCAALPEKGLGIAVKCDDGASRAAEAIMAHLLVGFGAACAEAMAALTTVPLRNWNAIHTGDIRAAPDLVEALTGAAGAMVA